MVSQEELYNLIVSLMNIQENKRLLGRFLYKIEDNSKYSKENFLFHNEVLHNIVTEIFNNYGDIRSRKALKVCLLSEGYNIPEAIYELDEINTVREKFENLIPIDNDRYFAGIAKFIIYHSEYHSHDFARELTTYTFCKFDGYYLQEVYNSLINSI
jgi:hypothetical protein